VPEGERDGDRVVTSDIEPAGSQTPDTTASVSDAMLAWYGMVCGERVADDDPTSGSVQADYCLVGSRITPELGSGRIDLVSLGENLLLVNMRGRFHEDLSYKIIGEGWTRLHFRNSARASMDFEGIGQMSFEGPLCQILHQPEGVMDEERIQGGRTFEWSTLFMRPQLLVDRYHLDAANLSEPVRRLAYGEDSFLLKNWSLSPAMQQAISQLFQNPYAGDLRRLHLEAKSTELICLMSGVMAERSTDGLPVRLSQLDVDRLHEARSMLAREHVNPPGLEGIARQVGLNRNKLTYGFKHLFGMTISDFVTEQRLTVAWELLQETDLPVSHVAERVGYGQTSAFSTAFKRRFNLTPRDLRRTRT
jgi:AraC-like DNA-binding protein